MQVVDGADQVGDDVAVLPHRKPRQLDARAMDALLSRLRIKGVVDVRGDLLSLFADAGLGIVLGHRLSDDLGEFLDGQIADEGL